MTLEPNPNPTNQGEGGDADGTPTLTPEQVQAVLGGLSLEQVLAHPSLGKSIQSWSDKAARKQVDSAVQKATTDTRADTEMAGLDKYFNSLTKEQLAEELAQSPEARSKFAEVETWRKNKAAVPDETIAAQAQVYAYATTIKANQQLLDNSDLSDAVKAKLNPENYFDQGVDGIVAWTKDLTSALIDHSADKKLSAEMEKRWEATKQQRLAELDGKRPDVSNGKNSNGGVYTRDQLRSMRPEDIAKIPKDQLYDSLAKIQ